MPVSRRDLLRGAAVLGFAGVGAAGLGATRPARAGAENLGTLLDYAGGVPSAAAIVAAGHIGVIRYVSDRRKGAEWMVGKPLQAAEVDDLRAAGLEIVSCYQYGKADTADWRGGLEAGKRHAARGLELHRAAGGPDNCPIYASIDDNPSVAELATLIGPYLLGWESVIGKENTGVYANAPTITAMQAAGIGSWFWQHNWGTPAGFVHPAAHLHQFEIDKRAVGGVAVDLNAALKPDYGQWSGA